MKIALRKVIKHKGEDIEVLDLPLENLTGNDLIEVEEQIMKSGNMAVVTDFSREYLISVAAKALHMPVEVLKQMSAKDFTQVVTEVRNFLIISDSEAEEDTKIQENSPATSSDE